MTVNLVFSDSFRMEYDEDLTKNPFFKYFLENYSGLYKEAVRDQLLVCVPAATSLFEDSFDEHYIRQHLILAGEGHSRNLNNEIIQIKDNSITFGTSSTKILFRETLYSKLGKITVLCIQQEEYFKNNFIRTPTSAQKRPIIDLMKTTKTIIQTYKKSDPWFSNDDMLAKCIADIKTNLGNQERRTANCAIYNLYPQIIELLITQTSTEDSSLNKLRMNNFDLKPRDLKLPEEFLPNIAKARIALDELPNKRLASEKIKCVKTAIKQLTERNSSAELNADKLLSLLTYLILKSQAKNWTAQLAFITLLDCFDPCGEESYLLSTLEATILHLKQGGISNLFSEILLPNDPLFRMAKTGDAEGLLQLFCKASFECHPLCRCNACLSHPVVSCLSRDSKGFTSLHYTCMYGHTEATQALLKIGSSELTNMRDARGRTALHWAAAKGQQTCLLLVCHQADCDLNAVDFEGNTPLHLAVQCGHESCVKALLYYSEHAHLKLFCDLTNENGETSLHLAAKWGYSSIVRLMLEWQVSTELLNKKKQSATDIAQNIRIKLMLSQKQTAQKTDSDTRKLWGGMAKQLSFIRKVKPRPA